MKSIRPRRWIAACFCLAALAAASLGPRRPEQRPVALAQATAPAGPQTQPTPAQACCAENPAVPARQAPGAVFEEFEAWAKRYNAETDTESVTSGVMLSEHRAEALVKLIERDPQAALQAALPAALRNGLPEEVTRHLEERIDGQGSLLVAVTTPSNGGKAQLLRQARINGRTFEAHVYGRRAMQKSQQQIPLHGIALGGRMAVDENPVRLVEAGEPLRPGVPIANPDLRCPVSQQISSGQLLADAGTHYYYVCSGGHILGLGQQMTGGAAFSAAASLADPAWTQGPKTVLFIRVDFSDAPGEPLSQAAAQSLIDVTVNNFYLENSYGKTSLSATVTPLLRMPQPLSAYGHYTLLDDARAAALNQGYNTANYHLDVVACAHQAGGTLAGSANLGIKGSVLWGSFDLRVAGHEIGHNYGVYHANLWNYPSEDLFTSGSSSEYGDPFDLMGTGRDTAFTGGVNANSGQLHFNAYFKYFFQWLTAAQVPTVSSSGTYRIYASDQALGSNTGALMIPRNGDPEGRIYFASFRQKITGNQWLMNGVDLHWGPWSSNTSTSNGGSILLDTTPGSPQGPGDAPLVIGRTFADPAAGFYLTPIGKANTTPPSIDVVVKLGSFPGNAAPTLTLNASATSIAPGVAANLTATASDPNGDSLAFAWDFGDGDFGPNSAVASKSWGNAGEYVVRCTASDMKGGTTNATMLITVGSPTPGRISGRITSSGIPIPDAHVTAELYAGIAGAAFTDANGDYLITNLSNVPHTMSAHKPGYALMPSGFSNPVSINTTGVNFIHNHSPVIQGSVQANPNPALVNESVSFSVSASDVDGDPLTYAWTFDDGATGTGSAVSHTYSAFGTYAVFVTVSDGKGGSAASSMVLSVFTGGPATAVVTFVKTDTTSQGTWRGTYGSQGHFVAGYANNGDPQNIPGYAEFTLQNSYIYGYVWELSTTEVRALQRPGAATDRIAAAFTRNGINTPPLGMEVKQTDGLTHRIALYFMDWNNFRIPERIEVCDGQTGLLLDSRDMLDYFNGKYLVWDIKGHVLFRIRNVSDPNGAAYVNGIFFSESPARPAPKRSDYNGDGKADLLFRHPSSGSVSLWLMN